MFGTQHLLAFLIAGVMLNLTPGQDTLYIIGRSLAQGRTAGVVSALGIGAGCLVHITAAAIGLYSLLALFSPGLTAISVAGACYLIYLGIGMWMDRTSFDPTLSPGGPHLAPGVLFRQGMMTNLLNPKVALFFIAFLPQFIDPVANLGAFSFLFLGLCFLCTGTTWCLIVAVGAATIAQSLRTRPAIQTGFSLGSSLLFVALGIGVLLFHP
jgi:threonine/homoserine/homoserine lactone efflux protein